MNRILLLEDDVSLIDGLVYSLKKNEFDVEVARTVSEAKQYLSKLDRYDLLILMSPCQMELDLMYVKQYEKKIRKSRLYS